METYLLHLHHRSAGFISSPLSTRILLPTAIPLPPRRNPSILPARSSNGREAGGQPLQAQPAPAPPATETIYDDNWFDRLAINYMSSSIQATSGMKEMKKKGYDGLVEAAAVIWRSHGAMEQQEIVMEALNKAFPEFILSMIRAVAFAAPSKFSRELFSRFTTIFFSWLVGPCEVRESEVLGSRENNVVYIRKCRFLEATNCVGMCTNLCKLPSQKFIKNSLGMPTSLVPNFGDQSCEIIFGQLPPTDDPALKQPCNHKSCKARQLTRGVDCSS